MKGKPKAVFFDRDGTLIYEKPGTYLSDPAKVRPYKTALPALKKLQKLGFLFFIVSNQSGIGRGYFTRKEVDACHLRLKQLLRPIAIQEIVFCPHAPQEKCACRKPGTLLGEQLIKKYKVDTAHSYMVGDKKADVLFGQKLGLKTILMTTANGRRHLQQYPELQPDKITSNLLNAAKFIEKDCAYD